MVVAKKSYEDSRRKRVEENKKRVEALNLPLLSQALKTSPSPRPKPSPTKQAKPRVAQKQVVEVRRSTRFVNKPAPIYKEVAVDRVAIPRRIFGRKRNLLNLVLASSEAVAEAEEKAGILVWGLPPGCPIFTKSMQPSHVAGGFWLGLPSNFSERNLPSHDAVMTLIDEDGDGYPTKYLAKKSGLSGGWKGFAVAHHLAYGDALVFQLIGRTTFKVYIIRVNGSEEGNKL